MTTCHIGHDTQMELNEKEKKSDEKKVNILKSCS